MFKHLMVPLDGSSLAEAALPAAAFLAQALSAEVTLLHVIEQAAPETVHHEPHLTRPAEAEVYLSQVGRRHFPASVPVTVHVHTREVPEVARSLAEHASELTPDLIVMCAHGRGGLSGWLSGNIAQQVIARGTTPVLLIRPTDQGAAPPFACRMVLVPLDGAAAHERALPVAARLAQAGAGHLHLATVIPTLATLSGEPGAAAKLLPQAAKALLDLDQHQAEAYLRQQAAPWRAQGLVVSEEVVRGDPADCLMQAAQRTGADLVVLGTHGKTGLGAFWAGSVGPRVSSRSPVPLLLLPLPKSGAD